MLGTSSPPLSLQQISEFTAQLKDRILDALQWHNRLPQADHTIMDANVVAAFSALSRDPDSVLLDWLQVGCPVGVAQEIQVGNIFPITEKEPEIEEVEHKVSVHTPEGNYKSVEEEPMLAGEEIDRLIEKGFAIWMPTWKSVLDKFGSVLVSKLACIVKTREDGSLKVRNVLDLRRSGYNRCVKQRERVVLPRLGDLLTDIEDLGRMDAHSQMQDQGLSILIADFADAFHSLGVHASEWPYLIAKHPVQGYVSYRTVLCGGAGCPLVWGRMAAWLGRTGQALFSDDRLRMQIYVDDPAAVIRGAESDRRNLANTLLWWWTVAGAQIAWKKGCFGDTARWIGVEIHLRSPLCATASLPEAFTTDVVKKCEDILTKRSVRVTLLRKLAGKLGWAAGIAPVLWSHVSTLWAATADAERSAAAQKVEIPLVAVSRVCHSLRWVLLLFASVRRARVKQIPFNTPPSLPKLMLVVDASPWGFGAFAQMNGQVISYLAGAWTDCDLERLQAEIGNHRFQAAFEALALLIAMRVWKRWWLGSHCQLLAKSDSMAALAVFEKQRSANPVLNMIAREMALDRAEAAFEPVVDLAHVPGKLNEWADALS
eukprot:6469348-Amphidinium_carterae.1